MGNASTAVMTAEQLMNLSDRGKVYELQRGELLMMSPAGAWHGKIAMQIGILLGNYVRQHKLGEILAAETGFRLTRDPDTVRAPDVAFVAQERVPSTGVPRGYWEIAPDLVIEVVSPGDRADEVLDKVEEWLNAGVRQVWVIYPKTETVHVYRASREIVVLKVGDTLDGADVAPGFSCAVAEVFSR